MNLINIDIPEDVHSLIFRYVYDFIIRDIKVLFRTKKRFKTLMTELIFCKLAFGGLPPRDRSALFLCINI